MKKFFSFMVLAVAALAMVSCKNNKLAEEVTAAVNSKDVTRLVAIGDSINGLGDKADEGSQANAAVAYLNAAGYMVTAFRNPDNADGIKGTESFTLSKLSDCLDNAEKLYNKTKSNEEAKKAYSSITSQLGVKSIEELISNGRQFVQAAAQEAVNGVIQEAVDNALDNAIAEDEEYAEDEEEEYSEE